MDNTIRIDTSNSFISDISGNSNRSSSDSGSDISTSSSSGSDISTSSDSSSDSSSGSGISSCSSRTSTTESDSNNDDNSSSMTTTTITTKDNNMTIRTTIDDTIKTTTTVPLPRFFLWIILVSWIGFLLGNDSAVNVKTILADLQQQHDIGQQQHKQQQQPAAATAESSSKHKHKQQQQQQLQQPIALQQYLKEYETKQQQITSLSVPKFEIDLLLEEEALDDNELDEDYEEDDNGYEMMIVDEVAEAKVFAKRKQFAEFMVHPTLLLATSSEYQDDEDEDAAKPAASILIAVEEDRRYKADPTKNIKLVQALVQEIVLHQAIEEIMIVFTTYDEQKLKRRTTECPEELYDLVESLVFPEEETATTTSTTTSSSTTTASSTTRELTIDCRYIYPQWNSDLVRSRLTLLGQPGYDQEEETLVQGVDVSIVLSGCEDSSDSNSDKKNERMKNDKRLWEKEVYALTTSVAVTCLGPAITTHNKEQKSYHKNRMGTLYQLFTDHHHEEEEDDDDDDDDQEQEEEEEEEEEEEDELLFSRIIDYNIGDYNMAIAFRTNENTNSEGNIAHNKGIARLHWNEAEFNHALYHAIGRRTEVVGTIAEDQTDQNQKKMRLEYFDAPDMVRLQFPHKYSLDSYCEYLEETYEENKEKGYEEDDGEEDDEEEDDEDHEDEMKFCDVGYDPYRPNIPIQDIYVDQSTVGENAGRGIFTSVDILEEETWIAIETAIHPVHYSASATFLIGEMEDFTISRHTPPPPPPPPPPPHDDMKREENNDNEEDSEKEEEEEEDFIQLMESNSLHRIVAVYGDAYGYLNQPWGPSEIIVQSHILTFANHGCNGTANIGYNVPNQTEFTLELEAEDFKIPDIFLDKVISNPYRPHRERSYLKWITETMIESQHIHVPIYQGQELLDNYLFFESDEHFIDYALSLRAECAGELGYVEEEQNRRRGKQRNKKLDTNHNGGGGRRRGLVVEQQEQQQHQKEHHHPPQEDQAASSNSTVVHDTKPNHDDDGIDEVDNDDDDDDDDDDDSVSTVDSRISSSSTDEL